MTWTLLDKSHSHTFGRVKYQHSLKVDFTNVWIFILTPVVPQPVVAVVEIQWYTVSAGMTGPIVPIVIVIWERFASSWKYEIKSNSKRFSFCDLDVGAKTGMDIGPFCGTTTIPTPSVYFLTPSLVSFFLSGDGCFCVRQADYWPEAQHTELLINHLYCRNRNSKFFLQRQGMSVQDNSSLISIEKTIISAPTCPCQDIVSVMVLSSCPELSHWKLWSNLFRNGISFLKKKTFEK